MALYPVQTQSFSLYGSGATVGDTTLTLTSFNDINGIPLGMASFGATGFGTIEPNNGTQEDSIIFTGITSNSNSTVTLTGVSSVGFEYPFTVSVGLSKSHAGSTTFIITNTSYFYYSAFVSSQNNQSILGYLQVPDPISNLGIANKEYVLSVVNGGAVSTDQVVVSGTAGQVVVAGQFGYLKNDGKWYLTSASASSTSSHLILGIFQTSANTNNPVAVLTEGQDKTQTGLTIGSTYYLSNTSGAISTSPGNTNVSIGVAVSAINLEFQPNFTGASGVPTGAMLDFGGTVAPTGYGLCDFTAYSRTLQANLFAVIGTMYGAGDGSTTFNVPDFRSRVVIGAGTGTKVATIASITGNVFTVTGLTNAANNEFQSGQAVVFTATVAGNLTTATTYYVIRVSNTTFSLTTSLANAQVGSNIITLAGTERGTFTLTLTTRTVGDTGGEENHAMSTNELLNHTHLRGTDGTLGSVTGGSLVGASNITNATGATGGFSAMNNMQPFAVATKIIKF